MSSVRVTVDSGAPQGPDVSGVEVVDEPALNRAQRRRARTLSRRGLRGRYRAFMRGARAAQALALYESGKRVTLRLSGGNAAVFDKDADPRMSIEPDLNRDEPGHIAVLRGRYGDAVADLAKASQSSDD